MSEPETQEREESTELFCPLLSVYDPDPKKSVRVPCMEACALFVAAKDERFSGCAFERIAQRVNSLAFSVGQLAGDKPDAKPKRTRGKGSF